MRRTKVQKMWLYRILAQNVRPTHAYTSIAIQYTAYGMRHSFTWCRLHFFFVFFSFSPRLFYHCSTSNNLFGTRNTNKWYMSMWCTLFISLSLIEKSGGWFYFLFCPLLLCSITFPFACTILRLMWQICGLMWADTISMPVETCVGTRRSNVGIQTEWVNRANETQ